MWLLNWFTGGEHQYMPTWRCMNDWPWLIALVVEKAIIFAGYIKITRLWLRGARGLSDLVARRAWLHLAAIFIFCGICGYALEDVTMFWPAYRLQVILHAVLIFYTWNFAIRTEGMTPVFEMAKRLSRENLALSTENAALRKLTEKMLTEMAARTERGSHAG